MDPISFQTQLPLDLGSQTLLDPISWLPNPARPQLLDLTSCQTPSPAASQLRPCCSSSAFCRLRSSMSCWCVLFFRRMYWMYSVALSRIWARDACCNSGKSQRQDKDLVQGGKLEFHLPHATLALVLTGDSCGTREPRECPKSRNLDHRWVLSVLPARSINSPSLPGARAQNPAGCGSCP